jgi:uncharacterized protein (TIGR03435 family)
MGKRLSLKMAVSSQQALASVWIIGLTISLASSAIAQVVQTQPQPSQISSPHPIRPMFDVASIRPNKNSRPMDSVEINFLVASGKGSNHGRFQLEGVPLSVLVGLAYDLQSSQIVGLPSWANSDRYDINARAAEDATFEQMRPMLQSLLEERFKLTSHEETKELQVYELGVSKGGLKVVPTKAGSCIVQNPNMSPPPRRPDHSLAPLNICGGVRKEMVGAGNEVVERIEAIGVLMPKFVEMLSKEVGRTVIDKTNFTETFDVQLRFSRAGLSADDPGPAPLSESGGVLPAADLSAPSLFTALQEQMGLRLQAARGLVKVLRIEHVEKASEN